MSAQSEFRGFVCWEADELPRIIDTEALQPSEGVFLATHHPMKMFRRTGGQAEPELYNEERFYEAFVSEAEFLAL